MVATLLHRSKVTTDRAAAAAAASPPPSPPPPPPPPLSPLPPIIPVTPLLSTNMTVRPLCLLTSVLLGPSRSFKRQQEQQQYRQQCTSCNAYIMFRKNPTFGKRKNSHLDLVGSISEMISTDETIRLNGKLNVGIFIVHTVRTFE